MDETLLPVTIGIFGDWGDGKTNDLRTFEQDLDSKKLPEGNEELKYEKVVCLYFNPHARISARYPAA